MTLNKNPNPRLDYDGTEEKENAKGNMIND
jgi:hypothetical protein